MVETTAGFDFGELPHLATFAAVAERGSFTATAAQLGVTQAAVSQRIAVLEKELRVSLFNRQARRISLSDAGQRLYQYARANPRIARAGPDGHRRLPADRCGRFAGRGKFRPW